MNGARASLRTADARAVPVPGANSVLRFFTVQLTALVVLQKFAFQVGGGSLEWPLLIFFVGLAWLAARGAVAIDPLRLVAFTLLLVTVLLSVMFAARPFSVGALALFLLLYIPLVIVSEVPERVHRAMLGVFVRVGVAVAALVFVEQAFNYTVGHRYWPNIDALVPRSLLFPGFNYLQPFAWGSPIIKPNAIVFLEVSYVSQFLALAIVAEIVGHRRPLVLGALAGGLLLTFAGTGLLLLVLTFPLLLGRADRRLILAGAISAAVFVAVLMTTGWADAITGRLGEFSQPNSSGHQRYTAPFATTIAAFNDPAYLFTGLGAGNVPTLDQNPLPVTKLVSEYGVLATIAFYGLFGLALFRRARSLTIAWALFLFFNLGGGSLSVPFCVLLCVLAGTLAPRTGKVRADE